MRIQRNDVTDVLMATHQDRRPGVEETHNRRGHRAIDLLAASYRTSDVGLWSAESTHVSGKHLLMFEREVHLHPDASSIMITRNTAEKCTKMQHLQSMNRNHTHQRADYQMKSPKYN